MRSSVLVDNFILHKYFKYLGLFYINLRILSFCKLNITLQHTFIHVEVIMMEAEDFDLYYDKAPIDCE